MRELNRQIDERAQAHAPYGSHGSLCPALRVQLSEAVAAQRGQRCEKSAFNMTLINYMVPSDRKAALRHMCTQCV